MNMEDRICYHVFHGFQCERDGKQHFRDNYKRLNNGTEPSELLLTVFEIAYREAWRESRMNWTFHNGEPK